MRTPDLALFAVTAGLVVNGSPAPQAVAHQVESAAATPNVAALNVQAGDLMSDLATNLLALKRAAPHNKHANQATTTNEGRNLWAVEVDYDGKRPSRHAELGNYVATGAFTSKSKHVSAKNVTEIVASQKAGGGGPLVGLDLKKESSGGYSFTGTYEYNKKHYKVELDAATEPQADQQPLTVRNIAAIALQFKHIMKVAPTGAAIKKLLPLAFDKITPEQPGVTQPLPGPVAPAPTPSIAPETTSPAPVTQPTAPPTSTTPTQPVPVKFYPETPGVKPWKAGEKGYDVGAPNCDQTLPTDASWVYINVTGGKGFTKNPCFAQQVAAFAYTREDLYENTGYYDKSAQLDPSLCPPDDKLCLPRQFGTKEADFSWQAAKDAGMTQEQLEVTWILDNESGDINTWSTDQEMNKASFGAQADELKRLGAANVVEYTTTAGHNEHFGDWSNGLPNIGATTLDTAEEALTYCEGHDETHAGTWALQYDPNGIDKDVACP